MTVPFYTDKQIDLVKSFDIYKFGQMQNDPYMKGIPMMFMTTPRMNLSDKNSDREVFFKSMKINMPEIYNMMTTDGGNTSPFIKLFQNNFLNLDGKDLAAKTIEAGETYYGYKQTFAGPYIDSITGDTLSVKYSEGKYLPIVKAHKLWMDYREHVGRGLFLPTDAMRDAREIDFVSTVYYFILDFDMSTILYYCRYVGVHPISNPYSALTIGVKETPDIPEISIDYAYSFKQDLDESILMDFNKLASRASYDELAEGVNSNVTVMPMYDSLVKKRMQVATDGVFTDAEGFYKSDYANVSIARTNVNESATSIETRYKFKMVFSN